MTDALLLLADQLDPPRWEPVNRPALGAYQQPPPGAWDLWILNGGRGAGKTEAGAQFFCAKMRENPGWRGLIIAPTYDDAIESCVEGPSGVLANDPEARFVIQPGGSKLLWPNGSTALIRGTPTPREVERLRAAGNRHIFWWEEMAANPQLRPAYDIAFAGLREGTRPIQIATTTPRPLAMFKELLAKPGTVTTHGTVFDNPGVSEEVKRGLVEHYGATRIGRQELYGELLEDVPGALWRREWFTYADPPRDLRVVVGVDPAITSSETSNLTGIVVAGFSPYQGLAYVLADLSMRDTPDEWARVVVNAYHEWEASAVVAEVNQGGDMVKSLIANVDPEVHVRQVRASRGKIIRAEPVAVKYEQRKVIHARPLPELEDQMCLPGWTLVETARGQVPICEVTTGDLVMTRDGLAPIAWVGQTGFAMRVWGVVHEHGCVYSTECHPLLLDREFAPARSALRGQHLLVSPRWASTVLRSPGAGVGGTAWRTGTTGMRRASCSIGPSTRSTADRSPKGCTSTIATGILATTSPRTSRCAPPRLTTPSTLLGAGIATSSRPILLPSRNCADASGPSASPVPSVASTAGLSSSLGRRERTSAVADARSIALPAPLAVWNLSVAEGYAPEFFADGVLVHNCSFTHDSEDSPDRLDAAVWALWALVVEGGRAESRSLLPPTREPVYVRGDLTLRGKRYIDREDRR